MDKQRQNQSAQELEQQLSDMLTEGEMEAVDRKAQERAQISPKYEIRIQTELDPIREETKKFRSMAKEVDGRYDRYVKNEE
ncbi:hypothetical protein [Paenibacillus terrigena]|uniref:hypothetical protein n=1 Tax=Paenibacillus terrigena TaxID=369333 RepID=UPI0028D25C4B|nr:hypothetical protein [Paenibacillus terrigena]